MGLSDIYQNLRAECGDEELQRLYDMGKFELASMVYDAMCGGVPPQGEDRKAIETMYVSKLSYDEMIDAYLFWKKYLV